jgi:SAM-dependent methyltransferase
MSLSKSLPTLSFGASMRFPLILKAWQFVDSSKVLEVGCGQGRLSARLILLSGSYVGCEPDPESHAFATELLGEKKIVLGTTTDLHAGSIFTTIFSSEVLEHIEDDFAKVKKWNSLLQLDGKCIVTVPAHPILYGIADKRVGHHRRYRKETLSQLFTNNGFKVEEIRQYGGIASLVLLACQNIFASFDKAKEKSNLEKKFESGRWHQSESTKWYGPTARKLFVGSSKFPRSFGSSFFVVIQKEREV